MVQEIAIRVRLREQERVGLAEYERAVASVATVAALAAWLPTPDARLVIRGRAAEPVRLETVTYGSVIEMLVVLDQRSAAVERGAAAIAALIESVRHEHVEDDVAGVAGELDRLDRSAPRGRSVVERTLRAFLEGARADVLARRTTTRVRAAQALVRLAEDGASVVVERVEDALARTVEAHEVDVLADTGSAVVVEPVDGLESPAPGSEPVPVRATVSAESAHGDERWAATSDEDLKPEKKSDKQDAKKKSDKQDAKKQDAKKKDAKKQDAKKQDAKKKDAKKKDAKKQDGKKQDGKKKS